MSLPTPKHSPRTIRITNPVSGSGYTNRNRAKRFVASGRARWVGPSTIEFVLGDPRHQAAKHSARTTEIGYDRVDRVLNTREMANVPIIAPWKLLIRRGVYA
jgi:hypothetical protein